MDSSGKNVRDLKLEGSDPSWSPDGRKLAFTSTKDETRSELYIADPDGSKVVRPTHEKGGSGSEKPVWSPDGKRIAFDRWSNKLPNIYIVGVDGSDVKKISSGGGIYPTWSPDGKKLAFASARDGTIQIYFADSDGSNVTQLTSVKPGASQPAWSPDGNKILFTITGTQGESAIGILDVASKKSTRFAYSDKFNFFSPAWSPDGQHVLMETSGRGGFLLWPSNPYFPPNEQSIGWKHQILALATDGSESRQLTKADDGGAEPAAGKIP